MQLLPIALLIIFSGLTLASYRGRNIPARRKCSDRSQNDDNDYIALTDKERHIIIDCLRNDDQIRLRRLLFDKLVPGKLINLNYSDDYETNPLKLETSRPWQHIDIMSVYDPTFELSNHQGDVPLSALLKKGGSNRGHIEKVYLEAMISPNSACNNEDKNLLHMFCACYHDEQMDLFMALLEKGVDIHAFDMNHMKPIDYALRRNWMRVVRVLLYRGSFPSFTSQFDTKEVARFVCSINDLITKAVHEIMILNVMAYKQYELSDLIATYLKPYLNYSNRLEEILQKFQTSISKSSGN